MVRSLITLFFFFLLFDPVAGKEPVTLPNAAFLTETSTALALHDRKIEEISPPPGGGNDNVAQQLMVLEQRSEVYLRAKEKVRRALSLGRFIQRLDSLAWLEFPVVLSDTISNVPVHVTFDDLRLYPGYAQLEVIVGMELPQKTISATQGGDVSQAGEYVELFFGTPNLKFSHDGGIIGDATIGLYSDVPIGTDDPSKFAFILKGYQQQGIAGGHSVDRGTYVKIDCDGFVEMGVAADVLFSRDWIVPVNAQGDTLPTGRVQGAIQTIITDWNNMLVEINLPNFALASYPELAFNLSTAVFDFSDYRNSPNLNFPQAYRDNYLPPGNANLWRGVYIRQLEVVLPKQFKSVASNGGGGQQQQQGRSGSLILDELGEHRYGAMDLDIPDFRAMSESSGEKVSGGPNAGPAPPGPAPPPLAFQESSEAAAFSAPENGINSNKMSAFEELPPSSRARVGVEHLLIDGLGVSGHFYATNVIPIEEGRMNQRWRFSLTSLELELLTSQVVGFGFGGEIALPIAKKTQAFGYDGFVNIPERTYSFTVTTGQDYTFPVFKMAEVKILEGSYLNVTSTPEDFVPTAVLFGFAEVKANSAPGDDSETEGEGGEAPKFSFKAARVNFHGLQLSTAAPRINLIPNGYLSLENDISVLGFPIPVAEPTLTMQTNGKLKLGFNVDLNLMDQSDHGFAVGTDVAVLGVMDSISDYDQWENAGMNISSIYVNIQLPSLSIKGLAHVFDNDPVFGNGFQGGLDIKIGPAPKYLCEVEMNAIFGHTDFKYWYVDALVELPVGVPIIPEVLMINGIGGGAYYHMSMVSADMMGGGDGSAGTTTSGVKYEPDENVVLGLKASLPFASMSSETIDGVVTLELVFSGTGLQEIMFYGKCEIVAPIAMPSALGKMSEKFADRIEKLPLPKEVVDGMDEQETSSPTNAILASVFLRMNFEAGFEFQGTFRAEFDFAEGAVSGGGAIDVLASTPQNKWHIYIGGYSDGSVMGNDGLPLPPIYVSIALSQNVTGTASAYFLVGNDIPGPPPPPSQSSSCISWPSNGPAQNRAALSGGRAAAGTGFAFGAAIEVALKFRTRRYKCKIKDSRDQCCYTCSRWHDNKAEILLGAGFDISLLKYASGTYCSNSGDSPHGHKGWRATGRIWAFAEANVRYRGAGLSVGLGLAVEADLPNPGYIYATAYVRIIICLDPKVEFGDRCGTVYN